MQNNAVKDSGETHTSQYPTANNPRKVIIAFEKSKKPKF
jgi:hypothetical protein